MFWTLRSPAPGQKRVSTQADRAHAVRATPLGERGNFWPVTPFPSNSYIKPPVSPPPSSFLLFPHPQSFWPISDFLVDDEVLSLLPFRNHFIRSVIASVLQLSLELAASFVSTTHRTLPVTQTKVPQSRRLPKTHTRSQLPDRPT